MSTYPLVKASALIAMIRTVIGMFYVYGYIGRQSPVTIAGLKAKEAQYGSKMGNGYYQLNGDYSKGKCAKAIGHFGTDCSGLFRWAYWRLTGIDFSKSADGLFKWCVETGPISTMPNKAGVLLFIKKAATASHVGIYEGGASRLVIQAGSVATGITEAPIRQGWTHWGIAPWMDMDVAEDGAVVPVPISGPQNPTGDATTGKADDIFDPDHVPYLNKGDEGNLVAYMQYLLTQMGYELPKSVKANGAYGMDGEWGDETERQFRAFQASHFELDGKRLKLDGVCGPKSWGALTGIPCK